VAASAVEFRFGRWRSPTQRFVCHEIYQDPLQILLSYYGWTVSNRDLSSTEYSTKYSDKCTTIGSWSLRLAPVSSVAQYFASTTQQRLYIELPVNIPCTRFVTGYLYCHEKLKYQILQLPVILSVAEKSPKKYPTSHVWYVHCRTLMPTN
jgi:hypothetical protein